MVPGAAVIPGGPLEVDSNRDSLSQISGATALPSLQSNMENIYPPIINLDRFLLYHIHIHFKNIFKERKSKNLL